MSVEKLKVLKLMPDAELPTYGTPGLRASTCTRQRT